MSTPKAGDLPVGTVVATDDLVGIKRQPRFGNPWRMTNGGHYHDTHIDVMLAEGAQVLRLGGGPDPAEREQLYRDVVDCVCVENCAEHPPTACSLSGIPHVHPDDGSGTFGPCPVHPDAPGDH